MKFFRVLFAAAIGVVIGLVAWKFSQTGQTPTQSISTDTPTTIVSAAVSPTETTTAPSATRTPTSTPSLATSALLKVPFLVQAPLANWDSLHEDACEEASLIMVSHFRKHDSTIAPQAGDQEIKDLVSWETSHGYETDVTVSQLNAIASATYGMSTGRIGTATIANLQKELSAGRPVIIPAAGRLLGNPNYTAPGPVYHMLVVIGYDDKGFITNDPGTHNGSGYRYTNSVLLNAIHDWDKEDITQGAKRYLVFD